MTNRILSAGQPSPDDLQRAAEQGIKTVINLRHPTEDMGFDEPNVCAGLNMQYINIPIAGPDDLNRETVTEFGKQLEAAAQQGDVLVHCGSANRVGAMLALDEAWNNGADAATALHTGREMGMQESLEPAVIALLNS